MTERVSGNDLPMAFVGSWDVLVKEKSQSSEQEQGQHTEVEILRDGDYFKVFSNHELRFETEFDARSGVLISASNSKKICISYWRSPSADMIFAIQESGSGELKRAWSAQRISSELAGGCVHIPEQLVNRAWKIELAAGQPTPDEQVRVRELGAEELGPGKGFQSYQLYGLFHESKRLGAKRELYDILMLDRVVGSFNSIFGLRSLNIRCLPGGGTPRIFATLNRRFSVPNFGLQGLRPAKLRAPGEQTDCKFGQLMNFERILFCNSGRSTFDNDPNNDPDTDPDIGVWVGSPPT